MLNEIFPVLLAIEKFSLHIWDFFLLKFNQKISVCGYFHWKWLSIELLKFKFFSKKAATAAARNTFFIFYKLYGFATEDEDFSKYMHSADNPESVASAVNGSRCQSVYTNTTKI